MASLTNFGEAFILATMFSSPDSADTNDLLLAYGGLFTADGVKKNGCFIGLMISTGDESETGVEVSGTGYVRQQASFTQGTYVAGSGDLVEAVNTNAITFGPAQANYGTIRSIGIFGAPTLQSAALFYINLATPITINTGESFVIPANSIRVNLYSSETNGIKPSALRLALDLVLGINDVGAAGRSDGGEIFSAQNIVGVTLLREGQQTVTAGTSLSFLGYQNVDFTFSDYDTLAERNNSTITRVTNDAQINFILTSGATVIQDALYDRLFIFNISSQGTASGGESNTQFVITPLAVTPITSSNGTPRSVKWQAESLPKFNIGAISLTLG